MRNQLSLPLLLLSLLCFISCKSQTSGPLIIECGGGISSECPRAMFCKLDKDCGGVDVSGVCEPIPQNCPLENDTFCGCDGKEYKSQCYANGSGITIAYAGKCMR